MRSRILLALLISCAPALLQAKNPTILVKDPPPPATPITSNTFSFGANADGGGEFTFQNVSGINWQSIEVTATLPNLTAITCGPGPFDTCTVSERQVGNGWFYNILFGPSLTGGVPNFGTFVIDLNDSGDDPNGSGSWPVSQDFAAKTNVTPEPASVLLLLAGGFLIAFGQRRRFLPVRS